MAPALAGYSASCPGAQAWMALSGDELTKPRLAQAMLAVAASLPSPRDGHSNQEATMSIRTATTALFITATMVTGCVDDAKTQQAAPDYGVEDAPEGKADSARFPASIEPIAYGEVLTATFTWHEEYRGFTFAGTAGQSVDLLVDGLADLDTVLYLYKVSRVTGRPFGRPLAANDDTADANWTVRTNTEPNRYSSNVLDFTLPEDRDYAVVATTFWQLYQGDAEVVIKTPDVPASCGGIAGAMCPEGQVCHFEPGVCALPDALGTCIVPPVGFHCSPPNPAVDNRVCGCDGFTLVDACHARILGASIAHDGPCAADDCQPTCGAIGSRSEGWYDGCTEELIDWDFCADCTSECRRLGPSGEGWYSSCDDSLIVAAACN